MVSSDDTVSILSLAFTYKLRVSTLVGHPQVISVSKMKGDSIHSGEFLCFVFLLVPFGAVYFRF
jgi:hypothetical protein